MWSSPSPAAVSGSYLKAVLPRWDINSSQVSQGFELGIGVIPKEGQNWNNPIWMDQELQLVEAGHLMKTTEGELALTLTGLNVALNPAGHIYKESIWYSRRDDIREQGSITALIFT